jgi:hypothetical protein
MTDYAVVRDGEIERFVNLDDISNWSVAEDPAHPERPYLLPVETTDPDYDPIAEVKEGPIDTVFADKVTHVFTVRPKNAEEIAAMKAGKASTVHHLGDNKLDSQVTQRQQIQALTRLVQLLYLHTDTSAWPAPQRQLVQQLGNRLANIQSTRDVEDAKVNEITALPDDPRAIEAYDVNAGW